MVKSALVELHVEAGERLLRLLDDVGIAPQSALWLRDPDTDGWSLYLATTTARKDGPLAAYKEVLSVFRQHEQELQPLQADDLVVVEPDNQLLKLYGKLMRTGPGISRLRSTGNAINGRLLPDGLLYRLQPPKAA